MGSNVTSVLRFWMNIIRKSSRIVQNVKMNFLGLIVMSVPNKVAKLSDKEYKGDRKGKDGKILEKLATRCGKNS